MLVSLRKVRAYYKKFKRLYYSDFIMPDAEDVKFEWFDNDKLHGLTVWDTPRTEPDDPAMVFLHRVTRGHERLLIVTLLHEMSHLANPRLEHGPGWTAEAIRLGKLGAMKEFF